MRHPIIAIDFSFDAQSSHSDGGAGWPDLQRAVVSETDPAKEKNQS